MIDQIVERGVEVSYFVCLAGWRALPVFALVAILSLVMRNRVPDRYLCWLWLIVIARLLLPISIHSPVAVSSIADGPAQALFEKEKGDAGKTIRLPVLPVNATAEEQAKVEAYVARMVAEEKAAKAISAPGEQVAQRRQTKSWYERMEPLLVWLSYWLAVSLPAIGLLLLLRNIASHLRFAWQMRSLPLVSDRATIDCLLRVCDEMGAGRRPKLKEVPSLHAPAMFGLFRPVVCLPQNWREELTAEQLQWVFRHEVAHIKGRDGLLLSIATLARSLHWFSPFSWIAVAKLQQSMERAADELATRHLNEAQVREYGELLLRFASGQTLSHRQPAIGLLAMAAPRGLRRRVESLGLPVRRRRWLGTFAAVPVICLVAVSGLTDAMQIEQSVRLPRPVPDFEVVADEWKQNSVEKTSRTPPGGWASAKVDPPKPKRTVSINVENALRKARELQPGVDAERFLVTYFAPYTVTEDRPAGSDIVDGVMTVGLTEQQELLMKQMLAAFEQSGLWQVVTELRIIDTNIQLLDQFDWSASESTARLARLDHSPGLDDEALWGEAALSLNALDARSNVKEEYPIEQSVSMPIRAAKISRIQSELFLHQVQRDGRSNIMHAPKVTLFNGQSATIADVVKRPFVTDVVEIVGDKATARRPKISVFEDGWKFLLNTTVTAEKQTDLTLVLTTASVESVKLANLPNGRHNSPDKRTTIQVPTIKSDSIAVESVLEESEAILIFSPKPYDHALAEEIIEGGYGMGQVFMIRTQLISDREFLKSFVPE